MTLSLQHLLPNLASGLSNTGFFFGAGTSVEAGYPMMPALTRTVVGQLSSTERVALDEVLSLSGAPYDDAAATPNIEVIADLVISHALNTGASRFQALEERLQSLVKDIILGVKNPNLDHHIRFLSGLRQRAFGRAACVYIFTTNYDVLFELAAPEAGVVVETGFVGSVDRFFDYQRFTTACGFMQSQNRFVEHAALTVRLIKLHGSVSWVSQKGKIIERHPAAIAPADKRVMILPRRRKVLDTLQAPHDALFSVASRALGHDCKYLASCGFSFGDEHINRSLLVPSVNSGRIKLFALCEAETSGMLELKQSSAFSAGFAASGIRNGKPSAEGTDCWRFSQFANLFA